MTTRTVAKGTVTIVAPAPHSAARKQGTGIIIAASDLYGRSAESRDLVRRSTGARGPNTKRTVKVFSPALDSAAREEGAVMVLASRDLRHRPAESLDIDGRGTLGRRAVAQPTISIIACALHGNAIV